MIALHRIRAAVLLACIFDLTAAVCLAGGRSAYRFPSTFTFSGWQPVGSQGAPAQFPDASGIQIVSQNPGSLPTGSSAQGGMAPSGGPDYYAIAPSISINLSTTSVYYTHIVAAVNLSSNVHCTLSATGPLAFFLDDREGTMDLHKLPLVTTWKGDLVSYEESGNEFITTDWAVKSITGPEYRDYTPGRYGTMAEGKGVQGLYWVFDRSLPGTVEFDLRNTIHTTITTPPGTYSQTFHVATGPVL